VKPRHKSQVTSHKANGIIFIICGPSGSGKTTLARNLLADKSLKGKLNRPISLTTRPKRSGEKDKKDYFFVSEERFNEQKKRKKILEWTKYLGYYYATPRDFIEGRLEKGKNIILCLDLKGASTIKRLYPKNTVIFFVMPPSIDALLHRITNRCNKTREKEIRQRLELARRELRVCRRYDYCIVNKDLEKATEKLRGIILKKIGEKDAIRSAGKTAG